MKITFLYGPYGSGKTTAILQSIKQDTDAGIHTFLIVPEQETVQTEHATLSLLPPSAQLDLEVLNFSRLYNRVCREYGNLSYRYITKPIRHLLMWQNLRELAPLLEEYTTLSDKDSAMNEIMLSALGECKASGITAAQLENTAKKLSSDNPLAKRLRDLALIFSSYDRLVSQNYSDSADDLSRLHKILQNERFFAGTHVYLDSFTSFTTVEHRVIEQIFAQAEQVTVTIPLSDPNCRDISTVGIRDSFTRLVRSADLHGGHKDVILHGNRRATEPALAYLAENIWRLDVSSDPEERISVNNSIRMEICDTPYAEAEAAAMHILELLRNGERCRDIVVLMRDPEKYRGIIEPAFDKNGISFFFSEKTDLCTLPPVKLLLSALRIKQYNWQKNDVISHIKTGLYHFSDRSADLFEEYLYTWNISGARFTNDDWTMNPDGFTESISERGKSILQSANEVRRYLVDTLEKFFILLDAAETLPEMCQAVYRYYTDIGLEDQLKQLAAKEASLGNRKQAKELLSLYGIILNTLADIAAAMPEEHISTDEFSLILRTVFRQTDIGTIPTSVDEVTIGSAAMLRTSNVKYVMILGLREGEFPAKINDIGLFTAGDRSLLSELGVQLSSDADTRSSDELMYIQRAFAAPSHRLYLFTSTAETTGKGCTASLPFQRVQALFPDLEPHRFTNKDLYYLVGSPKSTAAQLRTLENASERLALKEALRDHSSNIDLLWEAAISDPTCQIDPDIASQLAGNTLRFSSSRFEKYVECPFNYYCTYVLGLREKQQANFYVSHMGTFVHYVLEQLLRFSIQETENGTYPDDETLVQMTEKTVAEYIERICPDEFKSSRRLSHLYTRLKRLSLLMVRNIVEEFSHSQFQPAFFELQTNGQDGNPVPLEFILEDGCRVSFSGIIDRVDVLKKNGEVYIRIVDYKTGTKTFSLDDVAHGINIQMLLYLFTLCRNSDNDFARTLGLSDGQTPMPAGIVYLSANVPVLQTEQYDSEDEVMKQAANSLSRTGLLINDENLLYAMNEELSPKFLAGIKRRKKDGMLIGNALTSREAFDQLYRQICSTVENVAKELRGGVADAKPLHYKKSNNPCQYCKMKPICRKDIK